MEDKIFTVKLKKIINEFSLEIINLPEKEVLIHRSDLSRPGLALAGFFKHYEPARIQLIGHNEHDYIDSLTKEERHTHVKAFFETHPAAVIFTSNLSVFDEFAELSKVYDIPILRTPRLTSEFMAALIASLSLSLAPRLTMHGVFVEVYGEGILILGDSGVGKSETAIELVKRGHRLIADDAVEIKKASAKTLIGSAPQIIRHYVELRGIGIIDVKRIFGMGAIKEVEKVDMVIRLEPWQNGKMYDRFGLDSHTEEILGISVPQITIPVRPGRNLAVILEIAAMNNRQRKMGYDTAVEFNKKLMEKMEHPELYEDEN